MTVMVPRPDAAPDASATSAASAASSAPAGPPGPATTGGFAGSAGSLHEAVAEVRRRFAARRPRSAALHTRAAAVMPGGNTRTVLFHEPFPLRVSHAFDARIVDADGIEYVDLLGDYTAGLLGHSAAPIQAAITQAAAGGLSFGAHGRREVELAELVCRRFPAIESVRFTNSGTEANLMAVATARVATGRSDVVVFDGGYHGGLLSFGGGGSPLNAPYPFHVATYNDLDSVTAVFAEHGSRIAAVLVEPMLGSGGCLPAAAGFLDGLRRLTSGHGALLIADEVMTSRLSPTGAADAAGVRPDLLTLGKYVGGGMSFGAFGGAADVMARFDPSRPGALAHAGTFNNNVLSMSAGVAALTEVYPPELAVTHNRRGDELRARLNAVCASREVAVHITGQGSLMNVHPLAGPLASVAALAAADDRRRELLYLDLLEAGCYIARRGFIALSLALTDADLDHFVAAFDDVLTSRRPLFAEV